MATFQGYYITHALAILRIGLHTKSEVPSFTDTKDMIGVKYVNCCAVLDL